MMMMIIIINYLFTYVSAQQSGCQVQREHRHKNMTTENQGKKKARTEPIDKAMQLVL